MLFRSFTLYHHQINNISLDGKANIVVQELRGFLQDNAEKKFTLDGNLYSIDNTLVEQINTHNSNRLNTYNELMIKLQGKKSLSSTITPTHLEKTDKSKTEKSKHEKLVDEIKEYLKSCKENTKLNIPDKINQNLNNFCSKLDDNKIMEEKNIPQNIFSMIKEYKLFGLNIQKKYGGLELDPQIGRAHV